MQFLGDPTIIMIAQFVWGLAVKKLPGLAKWPNKYIPLMNTALAFLLKVFGGAAAPATTHASFTAALLAPCATSGGFHWTTTSFSGYTTAGFFSFVHVPWVANLIDSVWSAILVGLFHDKFGSPVYDRAQPTK